LGGRYALSVPACAAVGVYAVVGHVEGRLIGPFLVLLAMGLLGAVRIAPGLSVAASCLARAFVVLMAGLLGMNLAFDAGNAVAAFLRGEGPKAHTAWQVAQCLQAKGLQVGDEVGFVGFTFDAYWARLAGLRVVAEIPNAHAPRFWSAGDSMREQAVEGFRRAGVQAVVACQVAGAPPGWQVIPASDYVCLLLRHGHELLLATRENRSP
jgi:hypothetical protein